MKQARSVKTLTRLAGLREREVDRLQADMAEKEATRRRYLGNIERLQALAGGTPTPSLSPALAMNTAGYRQVVADMVALHRQELATHELDMNAVRQDLLAASRRSEVLGQVLTRQRVALVRALDVKEQKGQDDMAAQVWRCAQ